MSLSVEAEAGLPSIRQILKLIRESKEVEVKLMTNDQLHGKMLWQDANCICLENSNDHQQTLIWRQAIAYVKPH
ncbi:hypothetical protein DO97_21130 [Neosynechococcus sphagnicola sy1]|uniref:Hfq-related domain-containing protein n=1 Tax=Neosynechococcus sphagnicola sy1 TaxID=1497020 RepID=A0A098TM31_9CYAN|nr:RNA chaperone Hfq [Neosynechococcus sphagnicola]KGF73321.1 hypothetical protein DO97_21130 [Neosynechococcus sphagnicola sy1]